MNSFHHSRGRILFEVLCALTVSGSCALAWVQTGATAFLPASFAAALYGLWHLTDMRGPKAAVAVDAGAASLVSDGQGDLLENLDNAPPEPMAFQPPEPAVVEEPAPAPKAKRKSRKKQEPVEVVLDPTPVGTPVEEAAPPVVEAVEAEVEEAAPPVVEAVEAEVEETAPPVAEPFDPVEEHHPPIAPLFEPQPLVRQQRAVFGRKSG